MIIRRFEESDAGEVSRLIRTTIRISNTKDYPVELMDALIEEETEEHVLERASWTHFYVVTDEDKIIGCGAIGPYWGKEDESSLFTIFVHPDHQGKGIGRDIVNTLEQDVYFKRAKRIEIPASITGVPFYRKMGYAFKNGVTEPDEEHLIRMEKKRELWDLYDREGKRTGEIFERGFGTYQKIPQGRYHLVSDVLVQNKDGRFLLCKRHMEKDVYPGFWEASAGGSAKVGELPGECARRELKEETGLETDQLDLINVVFREPSHSLIYCYVARVDVDPDSVILQEEETVDYKWVDAAGLLDYSVSDVAIKTSVERYENFYNVIKLAVQNIHVRKAFSKDVPRVKTLFTEMMRTIYKTDEVEDGYEDGYLDKFFSGTGDFIYVAEAEGEVIAFLSVEEHNENERFIYLDDLSVTEKFRNRGIGRCLIGMAEMYSVQKEIPAIILHVDKENDLAYKLYKRLGYSVITDDGDRMRMKKSQTYTKQESGIRRV